MSRRSKDRLKVAPRRAPRREEPAPPTAKKNASKKKKGKKQKSLKPLEIVAPRRELGSRERRSVPRVSPFKDSGEVTAELYSRAYREMLRARLVDLKTIVLYKQNKCHFQIGCSGHEAVQVAAANVFRPGVDWFYPYYRDMPLCAALGMTTREFMLNAMNKDADPSSHGRQMPMHWGHVGLQIVNQSSPTGTQYLQAVGCAFASRLQNLQEVTYVSSGEGSCAQGDFHEALNWAARDMLPVVFLIQNNAFAISVPVSEQLAGNSVFRLTEGYENLARFEIDGTDFADSYKVVRRAYDRALAGGGPALIEAHVPRLQSHSISDDQRKYRSEEDLAIDLLRDPLAKLKGVLIEKRIATEEELLALEQELKSEIDRDAIWAEAQPDCATDSIYDHIFVDSAPWRQGEEVLPQGEPVFMVDAINHGLDEELTRNPEMYIFGEDVAGGKGGVFTVTNGLTAKHGKHRVFNSQLAESSIAGVAIGLATRGLKPVVEMQFGDYIWPAMMQIRNEMAMMNYRSGGDFTCPAVVRVAVGGYIRGGLYHSQNIEATFAHFPGLFIVYPSNATDAKGLLKSAIRAQDPVLFLEHKGLYRQVYAKGPEGGADYLTPIGRAKIVRAGEDLTIVSWGLTLHKCVAVANELERQGVSIEVIDLRTIVPLDIESVFNSVERTNRVLIVHEDSEFVGFGAEIAAQIASSCFELLDAPIRRVAMKNVTAVPHSPILENVVLPQNEDILAAAKELLLY